MPRSRKGILGRLYVSMITALVTGVVFTYVGRLSFVNTHGAAATVAKFRLANTPDAHVPPNQRPRTPKYQPWAASCSLPAMVIFMTL